MCPVPGYSWALQCWLHLPQPGGTAHLPPTLLFSYPTHIPPPWWWRHNGRLCQKLRGATPPPSPSPHCWLPHHRKQIYPSLGIVWLISEFSQLCTALPPPSRMGSFSLPPWSWLPSNISSCCCKSNWTWYWATDSKTFPTMIQTACILGEIQMMTFKME